MYRLDLARMTPRIKDREDLHGDPSISIWFLWNVIIDTKRMLHAVPMETLPRRNCLATADLGA